MRDADALDAWITDAEYALELGHAVTPEMFLAMSAKAESPYRFRQGDTWYMEEWTRVRQRYDRDARPAAMDAASVAWWRMVREGDERRMDGLAREHVRCLALAHRFVARAARWAEDRRKLDERLVTPKRMHLRAAA